jgi:hypothetical protein
LNRGRRVTVWDGVYLYNTKFIGVIDIRKESSRLNEGLDLEFKEIAKESVEEWSKSKQVRPEFVRSKDSESAMKQIWGKDTIKPRSREAVIFLNHVDDIILRRADGEMLKEIGPDYGIGCKHQSNI